MPQPKTEPVREGRRREAEARQKERDRLSAEEQLARLDERLGKGKGAARERARLQALIDEGKE